MLERFKDSVHILKQNIGLIHLVIMIHLQTVLFVGKKSKGRIVGFISKQLNNNRRVMKIVRKAKKIKKQKRKNCWNLLLPNLLRMRKRCWDWNKLWRLDCT